MSGRRGHRAARPGCGASHRFAVVAVAVLVAVSAYAGCGEGDEGAARLGFSDTADAAGLGVLGPSFAAAAADFDRDGWPDLAISAHGIVQLFRNRGGSFEYVSGAMGFVAEDTHGLSWIDLDRDGWLDLLVAVGANQGRGQGDNQLYRNLRSESLAHDPGLPGVLRDPTGRGRCLVAVDLDADGRLDVAVLNLVQHGRWNRLARAVPAGGYRDAGERLGIERIAAECLTAVHFDRSRTPTLIGYGGGKDSGRAFRPEPAGALVDVTEELGIPPSPQLIYAVAAGDYDNDGDLDLYLVRGHHVPPSVAALDGGGVGFRLISHRPGDHPEFSFRCDDDFEADLLIGFNRPRRFVHLGAAGEHPRSIPWTAGGGDPTLDGEPPAAAAGIHLWRSAPGEYTVRLAGDGSRMQAASGRMRGVRGSCAPAAVPRPLRRRWPDTPNLLLRNRGGRFDDVTTAAGAGDPGSGRDAVFLDADNDGDLDLFVVNGGLEFDRQQPDVLYLNRGDGTFTDVSEAAGIAGPDHGRGATVTALDYDRDGAIDLFVTNGDGPPLGNEGPYSLWHNHTTPRGGFVEVDLVGEAGNPAAMGASVLAVFGGRRLRVERISTDGRFSTGVLPLHFGLGQAAEARIEVTWPTGRTSAAAAVAGERLVLTEPSATPAL